MCEVFDELPLHPRQSESDGLKQSKQTPVEHDGSFLMDGTSSTLEGGDDYESVGFNALRYLPVTSSKGERTFTVNRAYESYLRMHKVLVGSASTATLIDIANNLSYEKMPRYLTAGGWAASEAALIGHHLSVEERLALLDVSEDCWERSLREQIDMNADTKEHLHDHAAPFRSALDIACLPLMRGIVKGNITSDVASGVFEDCLRIAQANMVQLDLALRNQDTEGVAAHVGFGYECNALLALNRLRSNTWFALPALARADTGYHHTQQTHDLLVVRQRWGTIESILPVEVKSTASLRDRNRYQALLVRGKMHLSVEGHHMPQATLGAITAVYEGTATPKQQMIAENVTGRFTTMLRDYYSGALLNANPRTKLSFHDKALVVARHPGLSPTAA